MATVSGKKKRVEDIDLDAALKEYFGFDSFKGDQKEIIRNVLMGNDTFVIMPTGGGKSLCYQLPAVISEGTAIVVSPLIALMKNQVDAMRYNSGKNCVAHFLNSTLNRQQTKDVKDDLVAKNTKLLYIAPETLSKPETIDFLKKLPISFFAIDEAHCISEWGHDFRPEYRRLREAINAINKKVAILTLTASATPKVQQDIIVNLGMENAKVFISSFNRPNLYYEVRPKPSDAMTLNKEIIRFIKENPNKSGIIYCLTRKKVEEISELLRVNNIRSLPYHAGLDTKTRNENQDKFLMEEVEVIVATIAFGMGIDKPDVRFVIHYDIPKSLEGYYQETGRAGRDGGEGKCIAFYSDHDVEKLYKFFSDKTPTEQEQANQLIQEMVSYAESSACRRVNILKYFGEDYNVENCGNCDNCLHPKERIEAEEDMVYALKTIVATRQMFKAKVIIDVMMGHTNSHTKTHMHHKLEVFGKGKDKDELYWKAVIRQAIFEGFVTKEIEQFGVLKMTPAGLKFVIHSHPVYVSRDHDYSEVSTDDVINMAGTGATSASGDDRLLPQLKRLRKEIAERSNPPVPPYVVFEDPSLEDMTIHYPITIEEMSGIIGVGLAKAERYGQPFIDLIKAYVEENGIERPQDFKIRSVGKTSVKTSVLKALDRKVPFEDIMSTQKIDMDELLTNMESIVKSGIKLSNMDYYIQTYVDEDVCDDLLDYFLNSESDSIDDAVEEFSDDDDITEDDIRLVRLKFLTDYGH
ncbi:MAG: DNA helicase RecQ [Bacteroidales bacterium]|nr:DNA helicase RecQ [Bacteroidales bacterium]